MIPSPQVKQGCRAVLFNPHAAPFLCEQSISRGYPGAEYLVGLEIAKGDFRATERLALEQVEGK
jgi:hypothetical protein